MISQLLQDLNNNLGLILTALTTIGLIIAKMKGGISSARQFYKKADQALDLLNGDANTKPLPERLTSMEESLSKLVDIQEKHHALEAKFDEHNKTSTEDRRKIWERLDNVLERLPSS